MIKDINGRFIKRIDETGEWQVVSNEEAKEKVSQGFRNMFRKHAPSTHDSDSLEEGSGTSEVKRMKLNGEN